MYLKPVSTAIVTITASGPSRSANRCAPTTFAPVEMPAKIPSSRASRRVISTAASSSIGSRWSTFDSSQCGITNPVQPWMRNEPRSPPLIAAEPAGSSAWMYTPRGRSASDTPIVSPGEIKPSRSAPSTIARAMRSFIDPVGFRYSSFNQSSAPFDGAHAPRRTSGVFPIASRIDSTTRSSPTAAMRHYLLDVEREPELREVRERPRAGAEEIRFARRGTESAEIERGGPLPLHDDLTTDDAAIADELELRARSAQVRAADRSREGDVATGAEQPERDAASTTRADDAAADDRGRS